MEKSDMFNPRIYTILHLPTVLGLVLAAIGGSDASKSDPSKQSHGHTDTKVAMIIFIGVWIVQSGMAIIAVYRLLHIRSDERRLALAIAASIPFLAVRLIYSVISAFDDTSTTFNPIMGNVDVLAFMAVMEEFIVVGLYLAGGYLISKLRSGNTQQEGYTLASVVRGKPEEYRSHTQNKIPRPEEQVGLYDSTGE